MLKYLNVLFITFLTLSCGSSTIEMDPLLKDKSLNQNQTQNQKCREDCKRLQGKAKNDCINQCDYSVFYKSYEQ
jgi:hypothetical protein